MKISKCAALGGLLLAAVLSSSGCVNAVKNERELHSAQEREMTLGIVQKEIKVGMSQADVATALGSPNMVTKDGTGKETWVYDKIASEASYSRSSGGVSATLILIGAGYSKDAGATATTQKTLTVVIKFNNNNLVDSFTYHTSKF